MHINKFECNHFGVLSFLLLFLTVYILGKSLTKKLLVSQNMLHLGALQRYLWAMFQLPQLQCLELQHLYEARGTPDMVVQHQHD